MFVSQLRKYTPLLVSLFPLSFCANANQFPVATTGEKMIAVPAHGDLKSIAYGAELLARFEGYKGIAGQFRDPVHSTEDIAAALMLLPDVSQVTSHAFLTGKKDGDDLLVYRVSISTVLNSSEQWFGQALRYADRVRMYLGVGSWGDYASINYMISGLASVESEFLQDTPLREKVLTGSSAAAQSSQNNTAFEFALKKDLSVLADKVTVTTINDQYVVDTKPAMKGAYELFRQKVGEPQGVSEVQRPFMDHGENLEYCIPDYVANEYLLYYQPKSFQSVEEQLSTLQSFMVIYKVQGKGSAVVRTCNTFRSDEFSPEQCAKKYGAGVCGYFGAMKNAFGSRLWGRVNGQNRCVLARLSEEHAGPIRASIFFDLEPKCGEAAPGDEFTVGWEYF